jgi:hypothetical protein
MFLIKVVEKIKTHFMLKHFFPSKILDFTGNMVGPDKTDDNLIRSVKNVICVPDN